MNWVQRVVFHAEDRQSGSAYGSPIYTGVNMPNLHNCDFVKVRVIEAFISADVAAGGDESNIEIGIIGKRAINQSFATGTGTSQTGAVIAHLPYSLKETGQSALYVKPNTDHSYDYLVFPVQELQDTSIQFEIRDGAHVGLVTEPSL